MGRLAVRLLGSFQVSLDGEPVTGFRSDKVRALLAYLCAEMARPHRRERVAGLLWPGLPERSARSNLRHALTNLRTLLRDRDADSPFLIATRQTLQIDPESDIWVDALVLAGQAGDDLAGLELAAELYRGEFMEGFSLGDSAEFEEWVLFQRERFQRLVMDALAHLAEGFEAQGELDRAQEYARRQVDLDPWREKAHRHLMRLLALSGQRAAALAQYERCRSTLSEGLGVEPSSETVALALRIQEGEPGAVAVSPPPSVIPAAELPQFLQLEVPEAEPALFVGREQELARLQEFLEQALAGEGRTVFVTGGAGRGKTALLSEFSRQAMDAQGDLLVANGSCSALAGIGDIYQPFREIMAMLTGDLEARWYAGSISREHARRLWGALPHSAQALLQHGPHVIGTLVRGPTLLARATAAVGSHDGAWLRRLGDLVQRQSGHAEGMEQAFLFEQLTNSLRSLAEHHPLLLILDDLHWADRTSAGLLFHLGSRLRGSRILLASAYRPEELSSLSQSDDHPLQMALAELKRRHGDVWVDLAAIGEEEARAFVDALVDSEPNRLQEGFRDGMFRRTGGHPLFVIELLRAMQTRGDLVRDNEGYWIEEPGLRWDLLPGRIEGVIEARIGRLTPELRDLLVAASVEGEEFTAQVLARVQQLDERTVLRSLSGELDRKHRLVQVSGETQIGQHRLSTYRFSHILFRDYLYGALGPGERGLLHRRIGRALEALHEGRLEEIAARLAHHFAGYPEKERRYARLAGERAAAQYANDEALLHLSRALELTPEADQDGRFALLLAREQVYDRQSDRDAQRRDLAALEEIATALADPQKRAEVTLRQASCAYFSAETAQCTAFAQTAAGLGQSLGSPELEARAHRLWAMALGYFGQHGEAIHHRERSLALARVAGARWLEAETLRQLSWHYAFRGEHGEAEACLQASLLIFQDVGDRRDEISVRHNLAAFSSNRFEYERAHEHWQEALRLSRELGARLLEATMRLALTELYEVCGQYATARDHDRSVLPLTREIGARALEIRSLLGVGCMSHALGESEEALLYVEEGLALARKSGERYVEAYALTHQGHVLGALGNRDRARAAYEQALALRREMSQEAEATEALAGLARLFMAWGDLARAMGYVEDVLHHLESSTLEGVEQPLLVYLTCYRVLEAAGDARAAAILEEGYQLLQEIAGKFTADDLRCSFLESVTVNREIVEERKRIRGA